MICVFVFVVVSRAREIPFSNCIWRTLSVLVSYGGFRVSSSSVDSGTLMEFNLLGNLLFSALCDSIIIAVANILSAWVLSE